MKHYINEDMALIRLQRELKSLREKPLDEVEATPRDEDMFLWDATILGPDSTPYEGGEFKLELIFPPDYPFHPPEVKFKTKVFHPNINPKGDICLNILRDDWKASLTVRTVLLSISSLLDQPNPDDPLVAEIAKLYTTNREKFESMAREWTEAHAMED